MLSEGAHHSLFSLQDNPVVKRNLVHNKTVITREDYLDFIFFGCADQQINNLRSSFIIEAFSNIVNQKKLGSVGKHCNVKVDDQGERPEHALRHKYLWQTNSNV